MCCRHEFALFLITTSTLVTAVCPLIARAEPSSSAAKLLADVRPSFSDRLADFLKNGSEFDMPTFVFDNLTFGTGSTKIQPGSERELESLAEILRAYPETRVTIRGQTDSSGDEEMNNELSLRRAESVKDALTERSIAEGRIRVQGIGPDVHGRQKGRRTELQVTYH